MDEWFFGKRTCIVGVGKCRYFVCVCVGVFMFVIYFAEVVSFPFGDAMSKVMAV